MTLYDFSSHYLFKLDEVKYIFFKHKSLQLFIEKTICNTTALYKLFQSHFRPKLEKLQWHLLAKIRTLNVVFDNVQRILKLMTPYDFSYMTASHMTLTVHLPLRGKQRPYRRDRRPKVNQPTKRAADYWPDLRTTETVW